jgi:uncharacterized protein (TIRG00374 family)
MMKTRTVIGLAISVAVIAGLLKAIPPAEVIPRLRIADPALVTLACLVNFATIALRARRWQILIGCFRRVPYLEAFKLLTVGVAVNSVVPLRAGEAVRSYSLASDWNMAKLESVSTVLVDRSFDAISFGALLLIAAQAFRLPPIMSSKTYGLAFSSIALMVSLPLVAWLGRSIKDQPRERFSSDLQHKIAVKLEPLARGYSLLTKRISLSSIGLSMAAWLFQILVALLVARALGVWLPLGGVVMAVFAVNVVSVFPLTPANIGVFQIAFLFALSAFGVDRMSAFAVATVYQAVLVVPVTCLGLILLNRRREGRAVQEA